VGNAATSVRALLVAVSLVGCADGDPPVSDAPANSADVWLGNVEDSDIAVAAVSSTQHATLFFCGGPSSLVDGTHWFANIAPLAGPFSLARGTWQVDGDARAEQLEGSITDSEGSVRSFVARRAASGTLSGLYDAVAPCGHVGLIVRQDAGAHTPSAQGTCLRLVDGAAVVEQVNPVMPLARDASLGIAVSLESDPANTHIVHPLVPAD